MERDDRAAGGEVFAEDFDREGAHVLDPAVHTVLVFHETVGVFVKNGLLDRDLAHDWIWVSGAWERLGPAALAARERAGIPEIFENFEALAEGQS